MLKVAITNALVTMFSSFYVLLKRTEAVYENSPAQHKFNQLHLGIVIYS